MKNELVLPAMKAALKSIVSVSFYKFLIGKIKNIFEEYHTIKSLKKNSENFRISHNVKLIAPQNCIFKNNVKIGSYVYINANGDAGEVRLGEYVLIGHSAMLYASGGKIFIDDYTRIGIGAIISASSEDSFANPDVKPDEHVHIFESIKIGKSCLIAGGAIILGGTELGDHCIVGAGAVVKGKYPANTTLIGNPARAIPRLPFDKK